MSKQSKQDGPTIVDEAREAGNHTPWVEQFTSDRTPAQWSRQTRAIAAPTGVYWVMLIIAFTLFSANGLIRGLQRGFDTFTIGELVVLAIVWAFAVRVMVARKKRG